MSPASADARAQIAALWDRAHQSIASTPPDAPPLIERLDGAPAPDGFVVWRVGGEGGMLTALPALAPDAPFEVRQRYLARIVANCSGTCPMCGAVAGISTDSERAPAAWTVLPVTIGIVHEPGCPAIFGPEDRGYFPTTGDPQ